MLDMYCLLSLFQIYKSTKCNDMVQTGACPRGAFCAFAHVERKFLTLLTLLEIGPWMFAVRLCNFCINIHLFSLVIFYDFFNVR